MKIVLLGKNGQVGWELQRALQPLGQVFAFDRTKNEDGLSGDISDFDVIDQLIKSLKPDVVVNAAAYTAVDKAEQDHFNADLINHKAVSHLAKCCKENEALLVHYSTDYVFDGTGIHSWLEDEVTNPANYYGKTKREGEIALEKSQVRFINFRTSWVYGAYGNNFIKTMLKLAQTKDELNIIRDQVGVPTGAALIADITAQALRYYTLQTPSEQQQLHGHYHLVPQGETTWYEYAKFIFKQAKDNGLQLTINKVEPIATIQYPTPAKRPLNSRLNNQKIQKAFKLYMPEWQIGVKQVIKEIL